MREDEIDDILECIGRAWKAKPHLRLGQLIANVLHKEIGAPCPGKDSVHCGCDPFYIPDWDLVKGCERLCGARDD